MIVLGLNAFGHDAAAVLLVDGCAVFAASEERYDRRRHSAAFPAGAIEAACRYVRPRDVDLVAFPWTRSMARVRKALHVLKGLPRSRSFFRETPDAGLPGRLEYLRSMRQLPLFLREVGIPAPLVRIPHHLAHAASARLALPDARGAVLTADGMGEWTTAAAWHMEETRISCLARADYPHSAGKTYAAVTQWLGFRPESDEGKTMGLAPYGDKDAPGGRFARDLIRPDPGRLLRVDVERFGYPWGHRLLYGAAFRKALGRARATAEPLRPGDADVARGIQDAVEDVMEQAALGLLEKTHAENLGLAGGLFLNCALNGRLLRHAPVPVQPFPVAGDAGAAWGAAARAYERHTGHRAQALDTLFLGHDLTNEEGDAILAGRGRRPSDLAREVALRIARGLLVGVARGRAEFGPRALGARSVLASPRSERIRDLLNEQKGRETWRPLAPVVLEDDRTLFHDLVPSPWMILTFVATPEGRRRIPGGIHVDGTARVQTVDPARKSFLADVIRALAALGEAPAVLNTSFNRRGEPIVNTAAEALTTARAMKLDAVVLGDRLLDRPGGP